MDEIMYDATPFHEELELFSRYIESKKMYADDETPFEELPILNVIDEFNLRFGRTGVTKVLGWLKFMRQIQPGKDTQMEPWVSQPHMKSLDLGNIPSMSPN